MTNYSIIQIGSSKTGWAIEVDGIIRTSHPYRLTQREAEAGAAPSLICTTGLVTRDHDRQNKA